MNRASTDQSRPVTSGSDARPPRPLRRPLLVDLEREASTLFGEPEWAERDRNSRTIATTDRMRITLTVLREGAEVGSRETDDTFEVQALRGNVRLTVDGADVDLAAGQLATMEEPSDWTIRATSDAVILLTVALGDRRSPNRAD
jgi:quercetin dioxygenase-like cupin family protein